MTAPVSAASDEQRIRKRGPRAVVPLLDSARKGAAQASEWTDYAARFLVTLESSILAGEAKLPDGLYGQLNSLLRGRP